MHMENAIVIGSGPAAHTACIYLARANLAPLMLEGDSSGKVVAGGLLTTTKTVENFPGFPSGIDGLQLTDNFRKQSEAFGTQIISETAVSVRQSRSDGTFLVLTTDGSEYFSRAIILATGSTPKGLDVSGYDAFWGRGISTCAVCDGSLPCYRNVPIAVVGGGDSACEEALHLAKTASVVYLIHRRGELRASKIMADRVLAHPKIRPVWNSVITEIHGGKRVEAVTLNGQDSLDVSGVFVAIGHTPNTEFLRGFVELDAEGYIVTGRDMSTSVKGVWAAGDVQDRHYKQAITAAGSGCMAALELERWLH
jgi:thioredoxin reductase (NADPH)